MFLPLDFASKTYKVFAYNLVNIKYYKNKSITRNHYDLRAYGYFPKKIGYPNAMRNEYYITSFYSQITVTNN